MCATCGCSDNDGARVIVPSHEHEHAAPDRTVLLEQRLLARNDQLAQRNRRWFAEQGILAVNLMSSPGAGKTTVLERTIRALSGKLAVSVVEGDQETTFDAERIRATGSRVVQVNTGAGCHLDADMLARALRALSPPSRSVVFVENVGNLVCPALFDLGEQRRVVITSVTEGADKPLKYPHMFGSADVVLLNKIDLLPHLSFHVDTFVRCLGTVNPRARVIQLSATLGAGVGTWRSLVREWTANLPR